MLVLVICRRSVLMNDPVNKIILSDDEIKQYREGGVLKIKNLLDILEAYCA